MFPDPPVKASLFNYVFSRKQSELCIAGGIAYGSEFSYNYPRNKEEKNLRNTARKGQTKHMDINQVITGELGVKRWQVDAAVKLIDEGNTIPFIARYRKEVTGTLDDAQLRTLHERLMYLRNLEEKKEQVEKPQARTSLKERLAAKQTEVAQGKNKDAKEQDKTKKTNREEI